MNRIRNFLPLAAVLVGAAVLGAPGQARATFEILVSVDGVNQVVTTTGTANSFGVIASVTDFNINISSLTNFSGTQSFSSMSNTTNSQITTSFGAAGGTHTIKVVITENGWTAPVGTPLNLATSAGGSIGGTPGNSVSSTNTGFLDNTNALAGQPATGSTGTQTASATISNPLPATDPLVYSPSLASNLVPGGTPFSMTEVITLTFTVAAGSGQDTANVGSSLVASPVPAPSGIVLALTALPFLGIGVWLRRRTARKATVAA